MVIGLKEVDILYADKEWVQFRVKSGSRNEYQYVCYDEADGWICTCEDYYYRKSFCKHMKKAMEFLDVLNSNVQSCKIQYNKKQE